MDGLISVEKLRDIFEISPDIENPRLSRHVVAAGRIMRSWVGDTAYDDALKTGPTEAAPEAEAPTDPTRKEALELAEAHLAMHYAVLGINTALRVRGIVHTERSGQGDAIVNYHKPNEVVALQQAYWDTARSLADVYLLAEEPSDEPFGAIVGGGSGFDCEGVTRGC